MLRGVLVIAIGAVILGVVWQQRQEELRPWSPAEVAVLETLWIGSLEPLPPDPTNAVADNAVAAELGHQLFFDTRLSRTGAIACATCHQPERHFTDGLQKAVAIGMSKRNTPSIIGAAYSPWLYWDGRKDSLWSQALSPLEDPNEHGSSRDEIVATIADDSGYANAYESLFGALPAAGEPRAVDQAFANIGKTIAAYQRLLLPGPARFDRYVATVLAGDADTPATHYTDDEIRGLRLFIGEAGCTQCHNGPLFTNHEFHNTGVIAFPGEVPDKGRVAGVREVLADPFNCLGEFSNAAPEDCAELTFVRSGPELIGAVRTPSLRNLGDTAPYMHKGQHQSLLEALEHYNEAPPAMIGHNEAKPLQLSRRELRQLEAFLQTLDAPPATGAKWLQPPQPATRAASPPPN